MIQAIREDVVADYDRDGVVCLRGRFDTPWIDRMRAAIERDLAAPGPNATNFAEGSSAGKFFGDMFMWKQDQPYWPVKGRQVASVWIALDPIDRSNGAVEFIAGSHRWGVNYRPTPFRKGHEIKFTSSDLAPIPDIDADRGRYDIKSWRMAPATGSSSMR